MKKWIAGLLTFVLIAWAALALGQTTAQDGQSMKGVLQGELQGGMLAADSTMKVQRMTSSGSAYVADESRDRDYIKLWPVYSTSSLAAAAGDSSSVLTDVGPYRYLKLLIKCTPIGPSANTNVRLAFQFRECMNGGADSTSLFPEYQYGQSNEGVTVTGVDTVVAGHLFTGSASTSWSGEYVVNFTGNRSAPASGAAAVVWSYPNGISLPLDSMFGRPARFNNLQIRVRNMNVTGPAVKLSVYMLGFAQ